MASPDFKQFLDLCNYLPDLNGLGPAIKTEQKEHLMMCCQTPTPPSVPVCTMPSSLTLQGPPSQSRTELCSLLWRDNSSGSNSTHWNPTWKSGTGQWALETLQQLFGSGSLTSGDYSALWIMAVSPVQAPALLEHRLLSAHLPADLQYALSCKSHCQASLQCPRARPPLRHPPPPPPQQGQGRRNLFL